MITDLHIDTPLLQADPSYSSSGRPLWLKMDALQPSGSFKLRGVGRLCAHEVAQGAREIVCASGGNAGFAAAYAGRRLGVPVTIVVPGTTAAEVRDAIAATGAAVQVNGTVFDEANAHALALAARRRAAYVHPFDHPLLWEGHATLIDEVVAQGTAFDCVVTSVGGVRVGMARAVAVDHEPGTSAGAEAAPATGCECRGRSSGRAVGRC